MIKSRIIIIAIFLTLLAVPVAALASNITNAQWFGTIPITNNSTAAANVATIANISTPDLIAGNYLNAGANNTAMRNSSGADVAFMPGYSDNVWVMWVPTIGANSILSYILYTANSTGGDIRYFPGSTGMNSGDPANMEPGDNFTIEISCFVNMANTDNGSIVVKEDAFIIDTINTENITVIIEDTRFEGTDDTSKDIDGPNTILRYQTFTAQNTMGISKVWIYAHKDGTPGTVTMEIMLADGEHKPTGGVLSTGTSNGNDWEVTSAWREFDMSYMTATGGLEYCLVASSTGTEAEWRAENGGSYTSGTGGFSSDDGSSWSVSALDFMFRIDSGTRLYAPKPSGDYIIIVTSNSTHVELFVDAIEIDNATLFGGLPSGVPDNANDWIVSYNATAPYILHHKQWVGGNLVQYIEWEYGATFTDLSGNGNDATPSFRTANSDPNVSANMTAFSPVAEAKAPDFVLAIPPPFISAAALTGNITGTFNTTPAAGTFPLAGVITAVADATDTPAQIPLLIIAAIVILAASLTMSTLLREKGVGSLIVKIIVITAVMGVFIAMQNFCIDLWMLVVFLILSVAMAMGSRQLGWT